LDDERFAIVALLHLLEHHEVVGGLRCAHVVPPEDLSTCTQHQQFRKFNRVKGVCPDFLNFELSHD
ncbi:MAG: hypothetical protein OXH76_12065, partial [Boseongicola sp.]|nr:hypothetical protein [Boseongicola sp.]